MKLLLPLLLLAGVVNAATPAAPAPAPELVVRANGYAKKGLSQVATIHPEDGIDAKEAFTIAEWHVLGAIDYKQLPVQAYRAAVRDGDSWRIDVEIQTADGIKVRPIYVDADTGYSHGDGWHNVLGPEVDVGLSSFHLDRRDGKLFINLRLKRFTHQGDTAARDECRRDAIQAVAMIERGSSGRFEAVADDAIVVTESRWYDVNPDRQWGARIPLVEKRPN